MDETIQDLTNSFQSIKDTSVSMVNDIKQDITKGFNYKKYSILGAILFVLSLLIVIFFLDEKYYKKNDKIQYHYILLDTICIMVFLILFYISTNLIKKLLNKI